MATQVHDLSLISLRKNSKIFYTHSNNMKHFKNLLLLVAPVNKESHVKICKIELGLSSVCTNLFH